MKFFIRAKQLLHAMIWVERYLLGRYRNVPLPVIRELLDSSDICIDVGAHAGSWSIPLSGILETGHVYAFEALKYYFGVLQMTMKLLNKKNVTVLNYAISNCEENVKVVWKDEAGNKLTGRTYITTEEDVCGFYGMVKSLTLDAFFDKCLKDENKNISFVKIDIEGAELFALEGGIEFIKRYRPFFYVEINEGNCRRYKYSKSEIFIYMKNLGYSSYVIPVPSHKCLVEVDCITYGEEGDVLFVPNEKKNVIQEIIFDKPVK